jgi:hypothetical protein
LSFVDARRFLKLRGKLDTEVKKSQFWEAVEILIKRNDSTVSEPRQSREVAIRPKLVHET